MHQLPGTQQGLSHGNIERSNLFIDKRLGIVAVPLYWLERNARCCAPRNKEKTFSHWPDEFPHSASHASHGRQILLSSVAVTPSETVRCFRAQILMEGKQEAPTWRPYKTLHWLIRRVWRLELMLI